MKLSYRGVKYENASPVLEVREGEIGGTYRGQAWRHHYLRHMPEPLPTHDLKYRGVAYCTGTPAIAMPSTAAASRCTLPAVHRREREKVLDEVTRTHLANIRRNLERRMEVAKAKGDEKLVRLLEQEEMAFPLQ
ncbi:MAG TPA: DUF4278 domain-containing protein [Coleofasciculaceae cyanobacterium]